MKLIDGRPVLLATIFLVSGIALFPIWATSNLPLVDYPNHLARMYILAQDGSSQALNHFYGVNWRILPNLAMDIMVPPLTRFIGVEAAGKVFLSMTLIVVLAGVVALHYSIHGRYSAWPFLSAILLYNQSFLWGFVNYVFGTGVAFLLAAAWIRWRERRIAWLVFAVAAMVVFLLHAIPFGIYLIIVSGYEIGLLLVEKCSWRNWRNMARRGGPIAAQGLPVLMILFFVSPTGGGVNNTSPFFDDLGLKLASLPSLIANYNSFVDFSLTFLPLLVGSLAGLVVGAIKVDRLMIVPLMLMAFTYIALPEVLLSSWYAWGRFMLPLFMLAIASTNWCMRSQWIKITLVCVVGVVFIGRLWVLRSAWHDMNQELASIRDVMERLPRGASLYPLDACQGEHALYRRHFAALAIIDREAFVPFLFANPRQQPVSFSPYAMSLMNGRRLQAPLCYEGNEQDWSLPLRYDYVLLINVQPVPETLPLDLQLVTVSDYARLYRVVR